MCSLCRLGKHETPPDIDSGRVELEIEIRNRAWIVKDDIRDLSRDMAHVIATQWATRATEMPGPAALHGEQKACCFDPAASQYHGARLNPRMAVGTCDHDILDRTTVLAEVEIDDGAIQTERDPFGALDPFAMNQREPGFGRPPLQRSGGYVGTETAQMSSGGREGVITA